jgi:hypothetical protein
VPLKVRVLLVVRVLLSAKVSVPVLVGVMAKPLRVVAVATPKLGAVIVGLFNVGLFKVGLVRVLDVKVSVPARVASVPLVGRVTLVVPEAVKVKG